MKQVLLFATALLCNTMLHAQDYWRPHANALALKTDKNVERLAFPAEYRLFDLSLTSFRNETFKATGKAGVQTSVISLPNADGQLEQFEITEASNFEPPLQAKFPDIRAFSGKGITDRYARLKLSVSPQGIQTVIFRTEKENEFIEPYSADHTVYAVFRKEAKSSPWKCSTPEQKLSRNITEQVRTQLNAAPGVLKTLRLAQSVTAEYSNYFGAYNASQVGLVLSAVNATLTRCNGVFERDLAVHLNLIASTTNAFYYDAASDPYDDAGTGAAGQWNGQLQTTLNNVIGAANYDIGHLFGASGGGGNAGCIGCVCDDNAKGSGFTSPGDNIPQGDNFDIDYVVHEMGHQLGANHTFSMYLESYGVNVEPGSGITIMGYAGITYYDVAPHSVSAFHAVSINQIQRNLATKSCPVTTGIAAVYAAPVANSGGNFTIPIGTPFVLNGTASDANAGDALSYSWEQIDDAYNYETGSGSVATPYKVNGPNWISYAPVSTGVRYFPKMATILAGDTVSGPLPGGDYGINTEALSSVSRTLKFRLTVRDNAPYSSATPVSVGQTGFADVSVVVTNSAGPFRVSYPDGGNTFVANAYMPVSWKVANTTALPIGCANVKISISTDGGATFSTLIASTPNDGSETVILPATTTTRARLKIEAVGNIFFDVSNADFSITRGSSCASPSGLAASAITSTTAALNWSPVNGAASYNIEYKASTAPSNAWVKTTSNTNSFNLTGLTPGASYGFRVRANCTDTASAFAAILFTTTATTGCTAPLALSSSAITSTSATVSFTAVSNALSYDVDYKTGVATTWTNAVTGTTSTSVNITGLTEGTAYEWRVRTICAGATSSYVSSTFTTVCASPLDVSTNGTREGAATIPFITNIHGLIYPSGDIDHYKFEITKTSNVIVLLGFMPADYDVKLLNSAGEQVAIAQAGGTATETLRALGVPAGIYYIQVYGSGGASSATGCYTLRATAGAVPTLQTEGFSTEDIIQPKADVYPNPAHKTVNINLTGFSGKSDLRLYDVNGRLVMHRELHTTNAQLDISTLTPGVYMMRISNGGKEIKTKKIIKE